MKKRNKVGLFRNLEKIRKKKKKKKKITSSASRK